MVAQKWRNSRREDAPHPIPVGPSQVRVALRHHDRGVPQQLRQLLDRAAVLDHPRRVRVQQIVPSLPARLVVATPVLPDADPFVFVDVDNTHAPDLRLRQARRWRGYTRIKGLNALIAVVSAPLIVATRLTYRRECSAGTGFCHPGASGDQGRIARILCALRSKLRSRNAQETEVRRPGLSAVGGGRRHTDRDDRHATASPIARPLLAGETTCGNVDQVYDNPDLNQQLDIERTTLCLINAERAAVGAPPFAEIRAPKRKDRHSNKYALRHAAGVEALIAARIQWWGKGADSHYNPERKTYPADRARKYGYFKRCPNGTISENTYTGAGDRAASPRSAVQWWMGSELHRATLLDPRNDETSIGFAPGTADKAYANFRPGGTYVEVFGDCEARS